MGIDSCRTHLQPEARRICGLGDCFADDVYWFDFPGVAGIEAIQFSRDYMEANTNALGWFSYFLVHTEDNVLVDQCGFKGKADESGMVEIGYAIIPAYQSRGLATEAAQGLIDYAFAHAHIERVDAHTLAEPNASTRVLEKIRMKNLGIVNDPDDGEIWHWSLSKEDYQKS